MLTCSFLAATFLTAEAANRDDTALVEACRRRALAAGVLSGAAALAAIPLLERDAAALFDGLTGRAAPAIAISVVAGATALAALWSRRFQVARAGAAVAVVAVVIGWGVGQYPWVLAEVITIDRAAGARATLWALVVVFAAAGAVVLPALGYLFWLTQRPGWARADRAGRH